MIFFPQHSLFSTKEIKNLLQQTFIPAQMFAVKSSLPKWPLWWLLYPPILAAVTEPGRAFNKMSIVHPQLDNIFITNCISSNLI